MITFHVQTPKFTEMINAKMKAFGHGREEAYKVETRLLCKELMKRTPPFSGKAIVKMLGAQGKALSESAADVEELSALNVGKRAVEKDIRKVIFGMENREQSAKVAGDIEVKSPELSGKALERYAKRINKQRAKYGEKLIKDGAVVQRISGRDVARIFISKGIAYGVDLESFKPRAMLSDLKKVHQFARRKDGRVSTAGQANPTVGRWVFLQRIVTKSATLNKYIRLKQKMVGEGKGGWAAAFMRLGGRMSIGGWVGKHARRAGRIQTNFNPDKVAITIINQSQWAKGGDEDRIIQASLAGRAKSLSQAIKRHMTGTWGKGGKI